MDSVILKIPNAVSRFICYVCLVSMGMICSSAFAQPNGCGTGWNLYLVPDRLPLAGCVFKASCDDHDICYGRCADPSVTEKPSHCEYLRCRPGGDLFGSQTCGDPKYVMLMDESKTRRAICDGQFYENLKSSNPNNPVCRVFASIYSSAVEIFGGTAFTGMGDMASSGLTEAQKERSLKAMNELLTTLSPKELEQYARELEQGRVKLDWSKEVRFSKQRKLYNP